MFRNETKSKATRIGTQARRMHARLSLSWSCDEVGFDHGQKHPHKQTAFLCERDEPPAQ